LTAALLASPQLLKQRFRLFFGASPAMARCCWYGDPTVANMLRYAGNRLRHFGNPEADVARVSGGIHSAGTAARCSRRSGAIQSADRHEIVPN
jgi:hypothetical protein